MRFPGMLLLVWFLFAGGSAGAQEQPVSYSKLRLSGTTVHLVKVDLNSPSVELRPLVAPPGEALEVRELLGGQKPAAAITGTFFDPATCTIIGNLVSKGRLVAEGHVGSAMMVGYDRKAQLDSLQGTMGRHRDWKDLYFAISGGPTLIDSGEICVSPRAEGFSDPGLFGARRRAAMGVTRGNKLLLMTTVGPVTLHRLALMLQSLGAVDAINLDGGSSTALYYRGTLLARPQRSLTNLVAVYVGSSTPSEAGTFTDVYENAYAQYNKGCRLARAGQLTLAYSSLRKAVTMAPDMARYWEALADVEGRRGNRESAADAYLQAAALHQERSKDGDTRRCAELALRLSPDRPAARALLPDLEAAAPSQP
ncbi:MAG: phosphodiester glycosidase family protein [Armatimonadetes bacterium]|nr:phosphodiester glycosidase family protein [Armatimonadota bacterium]